MGTGPDTALNTTPEATPVMTLNTALGRDPEERGVGVAGEDDCVRMGGKAGSAPLEGSRQTIC